MKNLNKNQRIGVIAGIVTLFVLFFSSPLLNLFNLGPSNNQETQMTSGLQTQELVVGSGPVAEAGDILTVHYVGSLPNGQVFDSSRDTNVPFEFTLGVGQVIRGWDEGLKGMQVGGKRTVVVPPEYGYGAQAIGAIPPNSTLIFEVELLGVKKAPAAPVESL